jgi:hypothetical protein
MCAFISDFNGLKSTSFSFSRPVGICYAMAFRGAAFLVFFLAVDDAFFTGRTLLRFFTTATLLHKSLSGV